jgi:RecA-family ATPase
METTTETAAVPEAPTLEKEFTEEIQQRIVAMMIFDPEAFLKVKDIIKPEYFENPVLADLVRIMLKFYAEYGHCIDIEELTQELDSYLATSKRPLPTEVYSEQFIKILSDGAVQACGKGFQYILDQVAKWIHYQSVKIAILKSINLLQKTRDYDGINKEIAEATSGAALSTGLDIIDLTDVEPNEPDWFWPDRLFKGELNLLVGLAWVGKSYFTAWLASSVTAGRPLPGTSDPPPQGSVLFLSCEDTKERITRRLVRCGGDKTKAAVIRGKKGGGMFSLVEDLPKLRAELKKRPDVVLLIVDPVTAYFGVGKIDTNKGTDVRAVLDPLSQLAEEFKLTIIGVMHLNKSTEVSALQRISGASAFGEVARAVWLVERDKAPEKKEIKYFTPLKVSDGQEPEALAWKINVEGAVEFLTNETPPSVEEQLSARPRQKTKKEIAKEFLLATLRGGPMLAEEIEGMAADEGINRYTLEAAKRELKIGSTKNLDGQGNWQKGPISWILPATRAAE